MVPMFPNTRFPTRFERHFNDRILPCFPDRHGSVQSMFQVALSAAPDQEAYVCDDIRVSYREFGEQAGRVAAGLQRLGVKPGDRVMLVLRNGPEFMQALFGTLWLGAIAVPVNAREQSPGLGYIMEDCKPAALVTEPDLLERVRNSEAGQRQQNVFIAGDEPVTGAEPFGALLAGEHTPPPLASPAEEDTAVILYTSGTTGRPKGAMQTHLNICHTVVLWQLCLELEEGERTILAVPGSHVTGLMAMVFSMVNMKGCAVLMREFEPGRFNELAARERMTSTVLVPAMYKLCLMRANFDELDLSAWRVGVYGGAPMPEATILEFGERLPGLKLMNAYGATETCTLVTAIPPEQQLAHLDSIGLVAPTARILVMDEQGREVAPGETGELWISGPTVIPGYWQDPERTAENFTGGFWQSGDIGSVDSEGYVRIFDRKKDMVIRGGYNIYTIEVENAITYHPAVTECAVVGQADPVLGEKLHAYVYTTDDGLTEEQVRDHCRARLADYKIPDFVTLSYDPLPRNANGKLVKRALRDG